MGDYKASDPFYHSRAWKRVSLLAIQRAHGMCEDCMERFRMGLMTRPHRADMVHHVIPRKERPDLALDLSNLRALCNACHNKSHPEKGRQAESAHAVPAELRGSVRVIKV